MGKILVTSALPYANGSIHVGHLVEYIETDIFVRFLKLIGEDVIYCCADDTHGTPIQIKAEELDISPEELIKKVYKEHVEDFKSFHIYFDSYHTTNSPENKKYSDIIFNKLKDKGLIYTKEIESFYDETLNRFLPDRYVKGECPKCNATNQYGDVCENCNATYKPTDLINPYSALSKSPPILKKSLHYFFSLSKLSSKLDKWLVENKNLQPEIVNYVRNWIKEGLHDWDISRDGPYFGFKLPGEENKYYYVWLDAPIGYIASTEHYCKANNLDTEKDYWKNPDSKIIQFVGKDIIYFHFLFWPAMLMESDYTLPDDLVVHGFLTVNGEKMSKSRGTFYTAKDFIAKYNPEYLRYYYAKLLSKKMSDIDLDFKDFSDSINNELVANIGNFCNRVLTFLDKNFSGEFSDIEEESEISGEIIKLTDQIKSDYNQVNLKSAVSNILHIGSLGNKYFQDKEPWVHIKENPKETQRILGTCVNIVKILAITLSPILPITSEALRGQLDIPNLSWNEINFNTKNHKIGIPKILLEKVDYKENTFPLNLKLAKITEVKNHPDADKLLVLKINLGDEERQIVAGIKEFYSIEELKDKNLIVVTNLKPTKLRGQKSNGMLLAAEDNGKLGLLTAVGEPGSQIQIGEFSPNTKTISFEEFKKVNLEVKNGEAFADGNALVLGEHKIVAENIINGKIR